MNYYLLQVGTMWMCHGNMCYEWTPDREKAAKLADYEVKNYLQMFFFNRTEGEQLTLVRLYE